MNKDFTDIIEPSGGCESHHVDAFEKWLGFGLPSDYRNFLIQTNGGDLKSNSVSFGEGRAREMTSIRHFYGLKSNHKMGDLQRNYSLQNTERLGPKSVLPIAFDDGGWSFLIFLAGAKMGEIWLRDSQLNLHFVAHDFRSFMESIILEDDTLDEKTGGQEVGEPKVYTKAEWAKMNGQNRDNKLLP